MLTLQLINQDPEEVIRRLAVKQFDGREPIMRIVELDKQRRALQKQRDDNAAVLNKMAAQIGALMKQGNRDEAENVKAQVASLKTANKEIDDNLTAAQDEITEILLSVPNVAPPRTTWSRRPVARCPNCPRTHCLTGIWPRNIT